MTSETRQAIILYGHPACMMVYPIRGMLDQSNAVYETINIFEDPEGRQRVREINNGYESVPTLVFPDGSTLTEPSAGAVRQKLEGMGYTVPIQARITGNLWIIMIVIGFLLAILRSAGIF